MSNPRDHSRHPARVPTSDATDSASVPWSGRELSPSGFETDTGATDPALLAALTADDDTLMAAVVTGRFLVPIVAEPVEIGVEEDALDEAVNPQRFAISGAQARLSPAASGPPLPAVFAAARARRRSSSPWWPSRSSS